MLSAELFVSQSENHLIMGWRLNIVNPVSVEDDTPGSGFNFSVAYPNPSRDLVSVGLTLEEARHVSVEAFDVTGRRVAVLHEGILAAGADYRFVFGEGNLPGGVYVVRAKAGGASVERRVTLVR